MQWEQLTSTELGQAARDPGVCIVPFGVLERHSEHLPLGTDYLNCHRLACLGAEREPAVVFPPFYFGQIYEATCFPGAVALKPTLLLELIEAVLDEIARNGFRKIIIYNGHGGNNHLLGFLGQSRLWQEKPYSLYIMPLLGISDEDWKRWEGIRTTDFGGHACEEETSLTLGTFPELVRMDRVPDEPARPLNRLSHLPLTINGIWWYASYPEHYAGDARPATEEKGKMLVDALVDHMAAYIAAVKADSAIPELTAEFYQRARRVTGNE
jgi:creatinine amidohydrolase